jgi:2,3,4,5-tetrahydropyridine-2-carboxylate N-succinyltransferase
MSIESKKDFKSMVESVQASSNYKEPIAFGIAKVDRGQLDSSKVLQASYAVINWKENFGSFATFLKAFELSNSDLDLSGSEVVADIDEAFVNSAIELFTPYISEATGEAHRNVQQLKVLKSMIDDGAFYSGDFRFVAIFEDTNPKSVESVYLKLYALSLAKVELRSICLDGAFGVLPNVAWNGNSPIELDWLRANEITLKFTGKYPEITSVDKFPRFLQHIIPADNTRILDSSKVRMGAQVHAGTTVMPGASYINFNAGTLGPVMVEGRISSSAIVGSGSDVGGGASILGVLSGTDGNPISIGENTLLGANSTTGIPLGDGCIVDAGVAILEGTKISITASELAKIKEANPNALSDIDGDSIVKGLNLASLNGIHYRQNALTGQIIALRSKREIKLNEELH